MNGVPWIASGLAAAHRWPFPDRHNVSFTESCIQSDASEYIDRDVQGYGLPARRTAMQLIPDSNVQSRFSNGFPRTIELICPHCARDATFEARYWQEHGQQLAAADADCSRCEGNALFVQLLDGNDHAKAGGLYTYPQSGGREVMAGASYLHALSGPLGRSYESALKLYNRAEWGPAALTVRHLLEGLAARLLGEDKRELPLTRQLEALPTDVDLARPLQDIAPLLAPNGAFGRHFDDEVAIDKVTAEQLLDLAEQLVSYLVVLPGSMAELKSRIATAPVQLPLRRNNSVG
jgi:hypothetical protein